jgi:hypothetical protein
MNRLLLSNSGKLKQSNQIDIKNLGNSGVVIYCLNRKHYWVDNLH